MCQALPWVLGTQWSHDEDRCESESQYSVTRTVKAYVWHLIWTRSRCPSPEWAVYQRTEPLARQGQGRQGQVEGGCLEQRDPGSKVLRKWEHSLGKELKRNAARPRVGEGKPRNQGVGGRCRAPRAIVKSAG